MEDVWILIHEKKLSALKDLLPCWSRCEDGKAAPDHRRRGRGEALATLVVNKLRGTFTACAVKAPGFGDRRKEMLKDIAVLTGGEVISEELASSWKISSWAISARPRRL